jgi:hypothetical protein
MAPSGDLEQTPLLSPDSDVERSGYKSVQVVITTSTSDSSSSQPDSESIDPENEEYDEEGGVHLKSSMNVFGVISLLLIGNPFCPQSSLSNCCLKGGSLVIWVVLIYRN